MAEVERKIRQSPIIFFVLFVFLIVTLLALYLIYNRDRTDQILAVPTMRLTPQAPLSGFTSGTDIPSVTATLVSTPSPLLINVTVPDSTRVILPPTLTLPAQTLTLPAQTLTLPAQTLTLPAQTLTLPAQTLTSPPPTLIPATPTTNVPIPPPIAHPRDTATVVQVEGDPVAQYRRWIDEAAARNGLSTADAGSMARVAACESGWDPRAVNPVAAPDGEHNSGLFQYYPSTWQRTPQGVAGKSIWDAHAQINATAWAWAHGWRNQWGCQ